MMYIQVQTIHHNIHTDIYICNKQCTAYCIECTVNSDKRTVYSVQYKEVYSRNGIYHNDEYRRKGNIYHYTKFKKYYIWTDKYFFNIYQQDLSVSYHPEVMFQPPKTYI